MQTDATATTRPAEASNDGSRGRGHFGLPAALRELRLSADLCSTDRALAKNPGGRGPLRPRDPGHRAGGRARRRAAVQGRHDRDSVRCLQVARNHVYARVLPAVDGGTRLPARAGSPPHGRAAPTGDVTWGSDWAPAGAGCPSPTIWMRTRSARAWLRKEEGRVGGDQRGWDHPDVGTMNGFVCVCRIASGTRPGAGGRRANSSPARELDGGAPEEPSMNKLSPELTRQVLQATMHQKILLRAAELLAMGWTRGTAARDATGQKVRSTARQATAWCVVGAVDRALYELWALDVYALLGLEVDAYDTAPCSLAVQRALRRPLQQVR